MDELVTKKNHFYNYPIIDTREYESGFAAYIDLRYDTISFYNHKLSFEWGLFGRPTVDLPGRSISDATDLL